MHFCPFKMFVSDQSCTIEELTSIIQKRNLMDQNCDGVHIQGVNHSKKKFEVEIFGLVYTLCISHHVITLFLNQNGGHENIQKISCQQLRQKCNRTCSRIESHPISESKENKLIGYLSDKRHFKVMNRFYQTCMIFRHYKTVKQGHCGHTVSRFEPFKFK